MIITGQPGLKGVLTIEVKNPKKLGLNSTFSSSVVIRAGEKVVVSDEEYLNTPALIQAVRAGLIDHYR